MIEIEAEHRQALAAFDPFEIVLEPVAQQQAVGQVGEGIVTRHMRDAFFGAVALGDLLVGGEPADVAIGLLTRAIMRPSPNFVVALVGWPCAITLRRLRVYSSGSPEKLPAAMRARSRSWSVQPGPATSGGRPYISM